MEPSPSSGDCCNAQPAAGRATLKERVNAITQPPIDDLRRDSELFGEAARTAVVQGRIQAALKRGFQTRDCEIDLARMVGDLD